MGLNYEPKSGLIVDRHGKKHRVDKDPIEIPIENIYESSIADVLELLDRILSANPDMPEAWIELLTKGPNGVGGISFVLSQGRKKELSLHFTPCVPYGLSEIKTITAMHLGKIGCTLAEAIFESSSGMWVFRLVSTRPSVTVKEMKDCHDSLSWRLVPPNSIQSRNGAESSQAEIDPLGLLLGSTRNGNPEVLLGERERSWLEFKQSIELDSNVRKIKLAQHISRFANSESGGLLVIGVRTTKVGGYDTASDLTPIISAEAKLRQIEDVANSRIYPQVRGLSFELVPSGSGHLIVVIIPAQVDYEKPFLVHGAIVDGKEQGGYFSIVRRRDEGSVPVTAREVHAFLAAGYNLMRRSGEMD